MSCLRAPARLTIPPDFFKSVNNHQITHCVVRRRMSYMSCTYFVEREELHSMPLPHAHVIQNTKGQWSHNGQMHRVGCWPWLGASPCCQYIYMPNMPNLQLLMQNRPDSGGTELTDSLLIINRKKTGGPIVHLYHVATNQTTAV